MSKPKNFAFTDKRDAVPWASVAKLYASCGFGDEQLYLSDSGYPAAYNNAGTIVLLALDSSGELIGMLRAFTDNKICTWVAELCVLPSWQHQGVGGSLVDALIKKYGHTAIYTEALSGFEDFWARHEIKPRVKLVACSRAGHAAGT